MPDDPGVERPDSETYPLWYYRKFQEDLDDGGAELWHDTVTAKGVRDFRNTQFWQNLQGQLSVWENDYSAEHDSYPLLSGEQPKEMEFKSYESTVNKSFRWNVLGNQLWPAPPRDGPGSAPRVLDVDPDDVRFWFGPHNWITEFPDIFRVRFIATYFDGARYLAEKILELARECGSLSAEIRYVASPDGYHAIHVRFYHPLTYLDFENRVSTTESVCLEIQVTTTIQATIGRMLHRVYEEWRKKEPAAAWQWDHQSSEFAVNYLGSTLHHLEGMIVVARQQGGAS